MGLSGSFGVRFSLLIEPCSNAWATVAEKFLHDLLILALRSEDGGEASAECVPTHLLGDACPQSCRLDLLCENSLQQIGCSPNLSGDANIRVCPNVRACCKKYAADRALDCVRLAGGVKIIMSNECFCHAHAIVKTPEPRIRDGFSLGIEMLFQGRMTAGSKARSPLLYDWSSVLK